MPTIPKSLVNEYIKSAKPFAETDADRAALRMAIELNSPSEQEHFRKVRNPRLAVNESKEEAKEWEKLILAEIHTVFCTQSTKYKKLVAELKSKANILIGMIAAAVAPKIGAAAAVLLALTASLLAMVCKMGISVFCNRFKTATL